MKQDQEIPTLFTINRTPVKVKPGFWVMVTGIWLLLSWLGSTRWSGGTIWSYLIVGGASMVLALIADVGHACAHTVGARMADAPMDCILLGADMPRTIYNDNNVPPEAHVMRSLGGPIFSATGLLIGILWITITPSGTAWHYLGEVWTVVNGFIFSALFAPIQLVDGGVIMKWLLVMRGKTEEQAQKAVRRLGWVLGGCLTILLVIILVRVVR